MNSSRMGWFRDGTGLFAMVRQRTPRARIIPELMAVIDGLLQNQNDLFASNRVEEPKKREVASLARMIEDLSLPQHRDKGPISTLVSSKTAYLGGL
jgi:hypothetical protein